MAAGGGVTLGVMAFALAPSLASTNARDDPIVGRTPANSQLQPTPVPIGGGDDEIVVRSTPRAEHDPNRTLRAPTSSPAANAPRVSVPEAPAPARSDQPTTDDNWPAPPGSTAPATTEPTNHEVPPAPVTTRPVPAPTTAPVTPRPTVPPTTTPPTTAPTPPQIPVPGRPVISPVSGSQICNDADTFTISYSASGATSYSVQIDGAEQRTSNTSLTIKCPNPQDKDFTISVTVSGLNANPAGGPYASVQLVVKAPMGGGPSEQPSAPPSAVASPSATPDGGVTTATTSTPDSTTSESTAPESTSPAEATPTP